MNGFDALRPITRRDFRVEYVSPPICRGSRVNPPAVVPDLDESASQKLAGPVISISKPNSTSIRLDWAHLAYAEVYAVYRATSAGGPFSLLISGLLNNFYVDAPLSAGTYYYKVTAIEPDAGETNPSLVLSATV